MKEIRLNTATKLCPLELTDVPDIYQAIDSQRDYLRQFLPFVDRTRCFDDTRLFVRSSVLIAEERGEYTFVIRHEEKFAGIIGFKDLDKENKKTEIGYWLCEQYQHLGIMTLAVKALCRLAFKEMRLNRVQIKCAIKNTRSICIPLRLGFTHEGIERQGELTYNGTFTDLNIYSLLKSDKNK